MAGHDLRRPGRDSEADTAAGSAAGPSSPWEPTGHGNPVGPWARPRVAVARRAPAIRQPARRRRPVPSAEPVEATAAADDPLDTPEAWVNPLAEEEARTVWAPLWDAGAP